MEAEKAEKLRKDVLELVKKDNVEFISLQFTDLAGVVKEVVIPVKELEDALKEGIWFDGSSIEGFARIQESDLFLKPDPRTYAVIPWLNHNGKTARFICDIYGADGNPYGGDPRGVLKRVIEEAKKQGFEYNVGPEPEFYFFRKDGASRTEPIDSGSYFDLTSYEGYKVVKEIISALKSFGIKVETSHHEVGKGQYEISFNYGPALDVADKLLTLKSTVKKIAQMHGLNATFMPKPIEGMAGSGMHVHQSLFSIKTRKNLFYESNNRYNLSETALGFIAGQIEHIKSICSVISPTVNSYKRLVSGFEAPVYIMWASMNRSALIRVPRWFNQKPSSARIELRCPDPSCNPYLAFAVMLKAGLEGIRNKLKPPEPVEENVYEFDESSTSEKSVDILPTSLGEALEETRKSKIVREVFGDALFNKYIGIKAKEWDEFKMKVTSWDLDKYFDVY